jgi:hypothetical protein
MTALLMLGITAGLCWLAYYKGYQQGVTNTKLVAEKYLKEHFHEPIEEIEQWVRQTLAGFNLSRKEEVDLYDDIDKEIKEAMSHDDIDTGYKEALQNVMNEPTVISRILQDKLRNVNKRYGIISTANASTMNTGDADTYGAGELDDTDK